MNGLSAGVMEILKLPFAPFVEFARALEGLELGASPRRENYAGPGVSERNLAIERVVSEFNQQMERLFTERELLITGLNGEGLSRMAVQRLRELAAQFKSLGNTYAPLVYDQKQLSLEMASTAFNASNELNSFAQKLEDELLHGNNAPSSSTPPDPKLLTALDRLGFSMEDLSSLDPKAVSERFKERAIQFHPDTKSEKERPFYEEQMKRLNEAKDLLTTYLERLA